jgi:hypothetical protein
VPSFSFSIAEFLELKAAMAECHELLVLAPLTETAQAGQEGRAA